MRQKITFASIAALIVLFTGNRLYSQITFQKTFGGLNIDEARDIHCTDDGGYIICGSTYSFGAGANDVFLLKTDSAGNIVWIKTYGGTGQDRGAHVEQTSDNGYIITGSTQNFGSIYEFLLIIKTDSAGNKVWSKRYHQNGKDFWGSSVQQTSDGGYIIAGQYDMWFAYPYLLKTDSSGNFMWWKYCSGATSVLQISNGFYFSAGTYDGYSYCQFLDSLGDIGLGKSFGGGQSGTTLNAMCKTNDGGFLLAGSQTTSPASADVYLVKLNAVADTVWTKSYGGVNAEIINSVCQTPNGNFIMAGHSNSFGSVDYNVLAIKTDSAGNLLASQMYGGNSGYDIGYSICSSPDGGFAIAGVTVNFGTVNSDIYLIKTDSNLVSGCNNEFPVNPALLLTPIDNTMVSLPNTWPTLPVSVPPMTVNNIIPLISDPCTFPISIDSPEEISSINIYPNPVNDKLNITTNNNDLSEISLYDITYRKLLQQKFTNTVTLNTAQLAKGIYVYEVRTKNGVVKKGKVVKE